MSRSYVSRLVSLSFALFLIPLAAGGCGDSTDEEGGAGIDQLPAKLAAAQCEVRRRCAGPQATIHLGSQEYCEEDYGDYYRETWLPPIAAAVEAGTARYDAGRAQAYLDRIRAASCDASELYNAGRVDGVFEGTIPEGGACSVAEECAGDSYCANRQQCPGTCAPLPGEGEACDGWQSGPSCKLGLWCASSGEGHACKKLQGEGGPCSDDLHDEDCDGMLTCSGVTETSAGTCRAWDGLETADVGEACDLDTIVCKPGLSCTAKLVEGELAWSCQPGVEAGASCTLAYPSQCPEGQHCLHTNLLEKDIQGTCGAPAKPGQDCYYWQSPCVVDAVCQNYVCEAVGNVGSKCDGDTDCQTYNCKDKVCAPAEACQ